jgi:hypothetical protein
LRWPSPRSPLSSGSRSGTRRRTCTPSRSVGPSSRR